MRRSLPWLVLVFAPWLVLSGTGTGAGEALPSPDSRDNPRAERRSSPVEPSGGPTRRSLPTSPTPPASSSDGEVLHPPLPVPDMPVPEELRRSALPAGDLVRALEPPVALDPSPAIAAGFAGLGDEICTFGLGCRIPPDTHGAAGPAHLMEILNTQVWVQNPMAPDPPAYGPVTLNAFWPAGVNPDANGVFDPRVIYDPYEDRWVAVALDDSRSASSALLVAVSKGPVPDVETEAQWDFLRIDADPLDEAWADYPSVGFNGKWVVVQVNMFDVVGDGFNRSHIYIFDKTDLYSGTIAPMLIELPGLSYGGTQVPAATYDAAEADLHIVQRWTGNSSGNGYLRLYRITGPAASPVLDGLDSDAQQYYVASPAPWDSTPQIPNQNLAPQVQPPEPFDGCSTCASGTCLIQTNDDRIQNVVQRHGRLWATHTIFLPEGGSPTRSSLQWWEIVPPAPPVGPSVGQRGRVDDDDGLAPHFFFAFPSIAVNVHGDALLGYSSFEGADYARASYSFRFAYDPLGVMRDTVSLKAGEACYFKDLSDGTARNRWGDYSATVADPDGTRLWTLQEFAALPDTAEPDPRFRDKWGTWWGMLDTTRTLSIADASVDEGDSGTTALTFTVTLSEPTMQEVTAEWSTADGTATDVDDYVQVSNAGVTFAPGDTTKTVTVLVNGDITYEGDETLVVQLANPTNATLADDQAQGTVVNDDGPQPQISITDVTLPEGDGGLGATPFGFLVTLSKPSSFDAEVSWSTVPGTAAEGDTLAEDYYGGSGLLTFSPGEVQQTVTVFVHGDLSLDTPATKTFSVVLSSPSGGTILKGQGIGTILDDDATTPAVEGLVVISDGTVTAGRNRLEWMNPVGGSLVNIRVKWETTSGDCASVYPTDTSVTANTVDVTPGTAGAPQVWPHESLTNGQNYCYTVWAEHSPGGFSLSDEAPGRPFDTTDANEVRAWKYSTGVTTMPPPTVGAHGVLAPSNDYTVHAMTRGTGGGLWPPSWSPSNLGASAQQRSPIVPLGGLSRAYFTTQDGRVHSVNAETGALLWSTQLTPSEALAAPAGIFTAWGGAGDYILVGTSAASGNFFYALDPFTGAVIDQYPGAGDVAVDLGPISSSASVDYARGLVYFASKTAGASETLWCLRLGPSNALSFGWKTPGLGDITGSPTLRASRVYVGTNMGVVWSVDAESGTVIDDYPTGDPAEIDFVFPDRTSQRLYFSTANSVWALEDAGAQLTLAWEVGLGGDKPSTVLLWPGTDRVYVGVEKRPFQGGGIIEIDTTLPDPNSDLRFEPLEDYAIALGPPSLDLGPPTLLHVGSEEGILYAVEVPFKPF